MTSPLFHAIASDDWKRELRAARERRKTAPERIAKQIKMNKDSYKSCAEWPKGTFDFCNNITTDIHETEEQAEGVCSLLRRLGAGGDGKVFPVKTWVEHYNRAL